MAKRRRVKVRITTWVDRDVLMWLKVRSLETRMGYQTLMNRMLQEAIAQAAAQGKAQAAGQATGQATSREEKLPPPVSRTEYELVLSTLKQMEMRLEGLKEAVQISQERRTTKPREAGQQPSHRPSAKRHRKTRKPLRKKPKDQRRVSQNSTS